jgi:hypothetical protein
MSLLGFAGVMFLIGLALLAASVLLPLLLAFAILGLTAALALCLGAIVPVARVWWFNREEGSSG